ncbi:ArsR/SmtB family transcription factor [Rubritalea sp.]|uniref:ArsR/SmtB family transcription factor n=1 Tax=Rubritalea sp. TaxID=2109375 RepID=UPI003EF708A9
MKTQEAVVKLGALSQESRLEIFRLLVRLGEQRISAGDIAEQMQIQPNTLSFHLKELTSAGLIQSERQGRSIIYSLNVTGMRTLIQFLTEDCCQGRPELCNPNSDCC